MGIYEFIFVLCGVFSVLSIFTFIIYTFLTNRKYGELCNLFREKFKYLPDEIVLYRSSGFFFTILRDTYFINILFFKKNGWHSRNIKEEHYDFIRSCPKQYTQWLTIKYLILLTSFSLFLAWVVSYQLLPR